MTSVVSLVLRLYAATSALSSASTTTSAGTPRSLESILMAARNSPFIVASPSIRFESSNTIKKWGKRSHFIARHSVLAIIPGFCAYWFKELRLTDTPVHPRKGLDDVIEGNDDHQGKQQHQPRGVDPAFLFGRDSA